MSVFIFVKQILKWFDLACNEMAKESYAHKMCLWYGDVVGLKLFYLWFTGSERMCKAYNVVAIC